MEVQEAQKQLDGLETLSCKNLKQVLAEHSVGFEGVVEKEELIRLAWRALTDLGSTLAPGAPKKSLQGIGSSVEPQAAVHVVFPTHSAVNFDVTSLPLHCGLVSSNEPLSPLPNSALPHLPFGWPYTAYSTLRIGAPPQLKMSLPGTGGTALLSPNIPQLPASSGVGFVGAAAARGELLFTSNTAACR